MVIFSIIILFLFGIIFWLILERFEINRTKKLGINNIDKMKGIDFERYIAKVLNSQGYSTTFTPASGDFGVDIVAKKNGDKYAIQIKRYRLKVGRAAISDAVAGMAYYGCNKSMVVTNSFFTYEAKSLARKNNCKLIDRETLTKWLYDFQKS